MAGLVQAELDSQMEVAGSSEGMLEYVMAWTVLVSHGHRHSGTMVRCGLPEESWEVDTGGRRREVVPWTIVDDDDGRP
jgi:hypothetical protein